MIHIEHLETDITQACQLSCVACNHHVPLYRHQPGGPKMANIEQVRADLGHLSKVLRASKWGALGGEPTLHPGLPEILEVVRESGIADEIEVWTNGISLGKYLEQGPFWMSKSWDTLVLSRYEGKLTDEQVTWIHEVCARRKKKLRIMDERVNPNFMTLFEPEPTSSEATKAKFAGCFFRHFSRVVNDGYFFTCCCAPHMPLLMQGKPFGTDGIPVENITERDLRAYLQRTEPLGACTICAGRDTAVKVPWMEVKHPLEWIRASGQHTHAKEVE